MDSKIERYINYVVNDLIKDTKIDYDKRRVNFPLPILPPSLYSPPQLSSFPFLLSSSFLSFSCPDSYFTDYIIIKYGVRESEIEIIWKLYKEKVLSLIKK